MSAVEVVEKATGEVVDTVEVLPSLSVEQVEWVAQFNLDRTRFFTRVVGV